MTTVFTPLDLSKNSEFKRNLLIGFAISFLLLIISSVASYVSIQTLIERANLVDQTNEVIGRAESVISKLKDAETAQRGFLITGKDEFLVPYSGTSEGIRQDINTLKELTIDNPIQQERLPRLEEMVKLRFTQLQRLISKKRINEVPTMEDMEIGRKAMDEIRGLVNTIVQMEERLLGERTKDMNRVANFTPLIIVITAALSMIIILVSFMRITKDHDNRVKLQDELEEKDRDVKRRIHIIQELAGKISAGEYSIRASDEGTDGLGNLSVALNKMASSLEGSFNILAEKDWLQTGVAGLNQTMIGEKETSVLATDILNYIIGYTGSEIGALYLTENGSHYKLEASFALAGNSGRTHIEPGQGIPGQAILSKKRMVLRDIPADSIYINYTAGELKPIEIVAVPLLFEGSVLGVLELGSMRPFSAAETAYLDAVSEHVGIAINTARNRHRLQELLHETQTQAEELQAQQGELENINNELEVKTEKLQASEEELRVQQEELLQANQELEERSASLEEKNLLISERNMEIQRKAEELALSTRYKSEFLANMSHELRTPLNSILLLSRLLSENTDKSLSKDQVEYAQVIQGSGQGLLQLINEILDLSKIESGKMELEYEPINLSESLDDMQSMFLPVAKEKGIEYKLTLDNGLPSTIEIDKMRLDQILRNLLSNAIKFTDKGAVELLVKRPSNKSGFLEFTVKDTGIGIAAEKQDMIFEAFQQADGSTRRKFGGTGLGLSITRELVRLLGGHIRLESTLNKGSQFTVSLPLSKPLAGSFTAEAPAAIEKRQVPVIPTVFPVDQQSEEYLSKVIPENIPDDRDSVQKGDKLIVIVEDDIGFARALLDFTRHRGYKGIVAVRGDEGIELVIRYQPIGILLDIQLPVKSGWQVMEELKSNPKTRHIPVHVMSSHEVRNKSMLQGAINFLNKPVDIEKIDEVFQKIEYIVSQKPRKVMIVEENTKHAKALAYYLETYSINTEIKDNLQSGINALKSEPVDCVIMDMGIPGKNSYDMLEEVKRTPGLENLPIIIFTGRSLSKTEEMRIRQYADSIVVKTAHSYQRILDEVSLFLHVMEEQKNSAKEAPMRRLGALKDVLNGKTVLIADDDVRNIFSLTKTLENLGMTVLPAVDGKEALQQLTKQPVDIVLMDMMMPELDGYETTQRIRENPKYKKLPVIAVTAKAMTGDREKCISAGASDYITKPVDLDQLLSLLRVWLYENVRKK